MRDSKILGSRWTFAHNIGKARIENMKYPEAAVAYDSQDMIAYCTNAGFSTVEIITDKTGKMAQSFVRAKK